MCKWEKVEAHEYRAEFQDPEGWYRASVKLDGCIDMQRAYNVPFPRNDDEDEDMADTMHICDIDEHIERLIALRDAAREHFGDEWAMKGEE